MTNPPKHSIALADILVAAVTVTIWTSFIVIGRGTAHRTLTPADIACARFAGSGLVMVPWAWWLRRSRRSRRSQAERPRSGTPQSSSFFGLSPLTLRLTIVTGLLAGWGYALFAYTGFLYAPAAHASVLIPGSLPLWTAAIAMGWLGDRPTAARVVGLALIVAGDLFVGGTSLMQITSGGSTWKGDALFVSASWCWAGYTNVIRRYSLEAIKATLAIAVFTAFTYVPAYAILALTHVVPSHLADAPVAEIAFQMAYQGLGPVVIAGITFTSMVRRFGPVRSTMITALVPALSALAAVIFLDEPLHWYLFAGLVLVTAGMLAGLKQKAG
jgi:drug/metabolite transporter (DMT)-like permease